MDTDLAYLAGFVDGEGTISLYRTSNPKAFRVPLLSVSSTDRYLLESFMRFGGCIYAKGRKRPEGHRQAFEYRLRGLAAIDAIEQLFPYLRHAVKRTRAIMIIDHYRGITKRNGKYTAAEFGIKKNFEEMFMSLTSRGEASFSEISG